MIYLDPDGSHQTIGRFVGREENLQGHVAQTLGVDAEHGGHCGIRLQLSEEEIHMLPDDY